MSISSFMKNKPSIPLLVALSWFGVGTAQSSLLVETFDSATAINDLTAADALISAGSPGTSGSFEIIDFSDGSMDTNGHFTSTSNFPGNLDDTFALHVTGSIFITTPGLYTFGLRHDDGVRLEINGTDVINSPNQTSPSDSFSTAIDLSTGAHSLDLVYYENSGQAIIELFAAQGDFTAYDTNFSLIGDTKNGGISTVPLPAGVYLFATGLLGLMGYKRKQRV